MGQAGHVPPRRTRRADRKLMPGRTFPGPSDLSCVYLQRCIDMGRLQPKTTAPMPEREKIMRKHFIFLAIAGSLSLAIVFLTALFSRAATTSPGSSGYHVIKTIPIGGEGGWDYLTVDSDARRVYVSRGTHVIVLDADTYAVVGDIPDTQGVHGIAVASELGRGFSRNGRSNDVTIFDLKTLKSIGTN